MTLRIEKSSMDRILSGDGQSFEEELCMKMVEIIFLENFK